MGFHFTNRIIFHFETFTQKRPLIIPSISTVAEQNQPYPLFTKTFSQIFQDCSKEKAVEPGRQAHARMIVSGSKPAFIDANCLLNMYVKCSRLECAAQVFDRMSKRNCVTWNTMMYGYLVHGEMGSAQTLFDSMPERNEISWNSLISGYVKNGNCLKAVEVFVMMGRDAVAVAYYQATLSVVLKAISSLEDAVLGKQVHGVAIKLGLECNVVIGNTILNMYAKCNMLAESLRFFDAMLMKNYISWSVIIAGCVQNGELEGGIERFIAMQTERVMVNQYVYASVFKSCAGLCDSSLGSQLHAHALKSDYGADTVVGTAILDMYAKCDDLLNATKVFNMLPTHNLYSYTALIVGYGRGDRAFEGLQLFLQLLKSDLGFNEMSLSAALSASSAVIEGLALGTQLHGLAIKTPFHEYIYVANAILNMYGKCGALPEACLIFDEMKSRNVISWSAMVCAYARHGYGNEALQVFGKMLLEKVMPNNVSFVGVLHACAHSGLADEALHYLCVMRKDYGLEPELEHYSCVVDALGRSGQIIDALNLIKDMPLKAHNAIWMSLLSNCKMYGNVEVAEIAARNLLQLNPQDHRAYLLLSQVYKDVGMWDEASKMRRTMRSNGLKKDWPGCSYILH